MYRRFKWKPNRRQKEAFKAKLVWQDEQLEKLKSTYNDKILSIYWNKNKSSLYLTLVNDRTYRISTHHLPLQSELGSMPGMYRECTFANEEIITNSRDNIIVRAETILKEFNINNSLNNKPSINQNQTNSNSKEKSRGR